MWVNACDCFLRSKCTTTAYKDLQSREDTRNAAWQRDGWDEIVYYTGQYLCNWWLLGLYWHNDAASIAWWHEEKRCYTFEKPLIEQMPPGKIRNFPQGRHLCTMHSAASLYGLVAVACKRSRSVCVHATNEPHYSSLWAYHDYLLWEVLTWLFWFASRCVCCIIHKPTKLYWCVTPFKPDPQVLNCIRLFWFYFCFFCLYWYLEMFSCYSSPQSLLFSTWNLE